MRKAGARHTIDCDVDTFWKLFFDAAYNEELHRKELGFTNFEIVEQTETTRRVRATPKVNMPKPVMALVGSGFSYEEEGKLDRAGNVFRWKMIPNTLRDKITSEGSVRVEAAGPGKCTRIDEFSVDAKIFGVGGLIESSSEKEVSAAWDKTCAFMNRWLRDKKGA